MELEGGAGLKTRRAEGAGPRLQKECGQADKKSLSALSFWGERERELFELWSHLELLRGRAAGREQGETRRASQRHRGQAAIESVCAEETRAAGHE